jgi:hypothetical protein
MILDCGPNYDKKTVTVSVDENVTVALTMSGGLDTALLSYMVCKELLDTGRQPEDYIKWIFTIPKRDGAELYPDRIIDWINNKLKINLPKKTIIRIPNLHGMYHGSQVWESILAALEKFNPDKLYMGDQRSAPESAGIPIFRPVRSTTLEGPLPGRVLFPLNHLYKYHCIDLFYQLGLEELIHLTHSCTQLPVGRCNKCYHCLERSWGFAEAGRVDPSIA